MQLLPNICSLLTCLELIGASLSELQGVMMSTALACVHTYVHVGEACLGTSEDDVALCTQCTSGIDYAH